MITADVAPSYHAWYGPNTVEFAYPCPGNPYDSASNDLIVRFHTKGGKDVDRLAYFDGAVWKAVLLAEKPGEYEATLIRNGTPTGLLKTIKVTAKSSTPFVRRGGLWGFQFESGKPYWPIGHNLGWSNPDVPDLASYILTMPDNGLNWSRIWACHWDGKNPWFTVEKSKIPIGRFDQDSLKKWDGIVDASEKAGVYFQFVLFHHGPWSVRVNSNWGENPWNTANGGFLKTPTEFFTNPRAKQLTKDYVRYMIARYGHRPTILSWELFNEVEWVDPNYEGKQALIGSWHEEMYNFVRKLDPYGRLVTSSSGMELPIYGPADYYQPHGYPASIRSMIMGFTKPTDKPVFYGEVGPSGLGDGKPVQVRAIRDAILTSLFMGHSGAAQFWSWDIVAKQKLQPEFKTLSGIVHESGILAQTGLKPFTPRFEAPTDGELTMIPGRGWAKTEKFVFDLPADADRGMGQVSSYFQGTGHKDMRPEPLKFKFKTAKSTTARIGLGTISKAGADLRVSLDGAVVKQMNWPASNSDRNSSQTITIPIPAGSHELVLDNVGPDWFNLNTVTIGGIGPSLMADATGNSKFAMLRIQRLAKGTTLNTPLIGLSVADGKYLGTLTDLSTGVATKLRLSVVGGRTTEKIAVSGDDMVLTISK